MSRRPFFSLALALAMSVPLMPSTSAAPAEPQAVPQELLVAYKIGTSDLARQKAREQANAIRLSTVVQGDPKQSEVELIRYAATMSQGAAIRAFQANPNVLYAEPNWVVTSQATSNDPYYTGNQLWGMYGDQTTPSNTFGTHAGEAWANDKVGSKAAFIGIIDEGIDFNHPDLSSNIWTNPNETLNGIDDDGNGFVDDIRGWDFVNNDNSIYDGGTLDRHGTHVAGTIGASGANARGVAGVNWNVTMISGKFLGANGGSTANAVRAVNYFTDLKVNRGINIVATNNSWGGGGYSATLHQAIIRAAKANILFIAAAGNSTSNNDLVASYPSNYNSTSAAVSSGVTIETPASYDNVIAVAAISSTGSIASFSSYGATTVDIGAPGVGIWSTLPGNTYGSYNGTSMATPHVTGAAALINSSTGLVGSALRTKILSNRTTYGALTGLVSTGGRLDLTTFAAESAAPDTVAPSVSLSASPTTLTVGSSTTLTASATDNVGISSVEFYQGTTLLGRDTTSPYTYTWTAGTSGSLTFTSKAFDAAGNSTTSNSVTITSNPATSATTVSASSVSMVFSGGKAGNKNLTTTVTVADNLGTRVSGATVRATIFLVGTATSWSASGITNSLGQVAFTIQNPPAGTYDTVVTGITATGLTFIANADDCLPVTRP